MATLIPVCQHVNPSTQVGDDNSINYMAPELLDLGFGGLQHGHATFAADIYALAFIMWQVRPSRLVFQARCRQVDILL